MDELLINKLDSALYEAYLAFKETSGTEEIAGISITLVFTGEIDSIVTFGFELEAMMGDLAFGVVSFQDIEQLVELDEIIRMSIGTMYEPDLYTAVKDIKARAKSPVSGPPSNGLWHVPEAGGELTSADKATGKGVIIAFIDSGIDYTHPAFMSQLTPKRQTRILRIWDQGLIPNQAENGPDPKFLISKRTYGVEYDNSKINNALNGGTPIKHKDCLDHGTPIGSIAAGGPLFPKGHKGNSKFMGVAPEASIIVVKFLDNPEHIFFETNSGQRVEVGVGRMFHDAVIYCLKTARDLNMPIVINISIGRQSMSGDGIDDEARFLDRLFDPVSPPGPQTNSEMHFPKGAILLKSAGNDGNTKLKRLILKVIIPSGGQIDVPFRLKDNRGSIQTTWRMCGYHLHAPSIRVHFWYRRTPNPFDVRFAMRLPHNPTFSSAIAPSGAAIIGFKVISGSPPLLQVTPSIGPEVHRAGIRHSNFGPVSHPSGGTLHRNHCQLIIDPKVRGGTVSYIDGVYWVRITAPVGTIIYVAGDEKKFHRSGSNSATVTCHLADPGEEPGISTFNPAEIALIKESTLLDSFGSNVITVSAYDDVGNTPPGKQPDNVNYVDGHWTALFSSRGPLRDFSDPPGSLPVIPKPDISAPGVNLNSANSANASSLLCASSPAEKAGVRFRENSGTSFSTPMVAGVIACMLEKNGLLNVDEVRMHLGARPGVEPAHGTPGHDHAYGKGMVDATESHNNTP